MRIQNNVTAINAHRQYGINNTNVSKSVAKLSSGYRINSAADDAAGLAISEKMRAQIRGLEMASKNSQDAVSLVQTAEGALQTTHDILQRMREIAVQAASDTNDDAIDRQALQTEMNALIAEIDDIAGKTKFNDQELMSDDASFTFQTGANKGDELVIEIKSMNSSSIGIDVLSADASNTGVTGVLSQISAADAISTINAAINQVSTQRSELGAIQNRLEFKIQNLDISAENLTAAEGRIRDVDMAKEMTEFTKQNILSQASTAMLAQANSLPQNVLQLLG